MTDVAGRECWCGSAGARRIGAFDGPEGESFPLVRCDGCGVLALWPQPDDAQLRRAYAAEYYGSSRRKFIGPVAWLVGWFQGGRARMAAAAIRPGARILDIGCGNGGFLVQMKGRGFAVEGTEWTAQSAARIPAEAGIPVHIGDLPGLGLPARSFDLVTLWHVFEHVRAPDAVLREIRRLLKPGGQVMLSLPNAESSQARRFGLAWFHHDPPRHMFGFGPRSIGRLLEQTGFQIVRTGTFSLEQNPFGYIQSVLNRRGTKRDRLYTMLKGLSDDPRLVRMTDALWLAVLTPPALILSTIESMRGEGATMTIHARLPESAAAPV